MSDEVKPRYDRAGDGWADAHRDGLGLTFNMTDVDGFVGLVGFAANTGDRLFVEYVPDNYTHRASRIRRFATVAMFDRKASEEYAGSAKNNLCTSWYLDICRRLGATQPVKPMFFWIVGRNKPPWTMIRLDIESGEPVGRHQLNGDNWRAVWEACGLVGLRRELRHWIDPPERHEAYDTP
jgi:hypothetical protein